MDTNNENTTYAYGRRVLADLEIQGLAQQKDNYLPAVVLSALYVTVWAFSRAEKPTVLISSRRGLVPVAEELDQGSTWAEVLDKMGAKIRLTYQTVFLPEEEAEADLVLSLFPSEQNSDYPAPLVMELSLKRELSWKYDRQRYSETYMDTLTNFFRHCLVQIKADKKTRIAEFRRQYNTFLMEHKGYMFGKKQPLPKESIMELIYARIREFPHKIALIDEKEEITYGELGQRINGVANFLLKQQVRPHDRIGLMVSNSLATVVAIAGIFKVGAGYVPIDYTYPEERQKHIMKSAKVKFTVGWRANNGEGIPYYQLEGGDTSEGEILQEEDSPGYVMFTSGTSGRPKGVEIRHRQLLNLLIWYCAEFKINQASRLISLHSFAFDTSFKNVFGALIQGGVAVIHLDKEYDFRKICRYIGRTKCTHVQGVTSLFDALLTAGRDNGYRDLETVISANIGGEKFFGKYIPEFYLHRQGRFSIANVYGTTEATDYSATHYLTEEEILAPKGTIPAGVPIYNQNVFVCSQNGFLCGQGVPGEIYLGGLGVAAAGYLDRRERNSRVFLEDFFQKGDHVYRTGDQGYWNRKGELVVLDRLDNQVKINGYRIELAEIEQVIAGYPGIDKCKVLVRHKQLYAFYTPEGSPLSLDGLVQELKNWFPRFMLPLKWSELEEFPLSQNGKIDGRALLARLEAEPRRGRDDFLSTTEQTLSEIWCKILELKEVGIRDNYFDLGGNSLTLFRLSKEIEACFKVKIKPIDFMELATIAGISAYLEENLAKTGVPGESRQEKQKMVIKRQANLYTMRERRAKAQKGAR
ncbi:non-ribosomal peptide synthetase [Desulfosporosinus shakirovi]|uniref:non-ribosomal peptide synthetase n=1 Tax=Desulfosporosinus shakirovi TaxID=2885154 RepID=UPI001E408934|nr:non-ribosomal peptide synthetase [Desulfosporosinus sp. SRJS8]MCB8816720.1 non-ribosomal peptide synthetase [Desulfosporosinus sp. SRJS8]